MGHDRTRIVDSNHFHEARERAERDDMRPVRPSSLVYIVVGRRPGLAAPRGSSASANMVARRRTGVVITDFHAKYFAYEFGRRFSSDSVETLTAVLADAQVDLNPHQIEAALFAFRSPFSKGAILADEVGLGKTIEAGLLLAQKWAERRRRMLVIVPANLRKQWTQELADKFYLPSVILEARSFNAAIRAGNLNPFRQDAIIVCSYQFARSKEPYLRQTGWDLIVIDEAHRLRNVYKSSSKIALAIKQAVARRSPKCCSPPRRCRTACWSSTVWSASSTSSPSATSRATGHGLCARIAPTTSPSSRRVCGPSANARCAGRCSNM